MSDGMEHLRNKPRVLWLAFKLFDKSVDKATWLETINALSDRFEFRLLTLYRDTPAPIAVGGGQVRYVPRIGRGLVGKVSVQVAVFISLLTLTIKFRPEIILINGEAPISLLWFLNRLKKVFRLRVVYDVRTLPVGGNQAVGTRLLHRSLTYSAKNFSAITYITETMRSHCVARFSLPPHRSAVWSSGVNDRAFVPGDFPDNQKLILLYHGGILSLGRGTVSCIEAIALCSDIPVELHLVSSLREDAVISTIARLGLADRVFLHETIAYSAVPDFINRCHAGIIPLPDFDGWNTSSPIKLFEYLACGRPVIVTPIPAHLSVLRGKPFAFFSTGDNPQSLADAIRTAYASIAEFQKLGNAARSDAVLHHTWDVQARSLGSLLLEVVRSG